MASITQQGFARRLAGGYARHVTPREALLMARLIDLRRLPGLTAFFVFVSRLGDGPLWWSIGLYLLVAGPAAARWAVAGEAAAIAASVALFMTLKNLIGRPRPFERWQDLPCIIPPPDRFSFPSGHTMTAFAVCAVLARMLPGSELFFLPAAVLIGVSRVFLGLHYPTDVLVGALLGSGIGLGVARLLLPLA